MNLWREDFIPINPFSRPGKPVLVRNIVIHYTANPGASAANHVRYFGQTIARQNPNDGKPDTYASAHMFIDKTEAVLIIPLNEIAYHASQANPYSLGIEMCIEMDGSFHPDTLSRAVEVVSELCKRFGLTSGDVIRHYDVTGKICPRPFVIDPGAWSAFREAINQKLRGDGDMPKLDPGVATTIINTWISPAWHDADRAQDVVEVDGDAAAAAELEKQKTYLNWLANSLRKSAGLPLE